MSLQSVLVVEHDSAVLAHVSKTISSHGYTVEAINSSKDALELAKADCPALLIVNPQMPGLSGIEAANKICEISPCKVIFISELARDPDFRELMRGLQKQGCDCFAISIPIQEAELLESVRRQIGPAAGQSERPAQEEIPNGHERRPAPTKTVPECQFLLEMARPSIYERNAFRLTGLPVDASVRTVSMAVQKLDMLAKGFGNQEIPPSSFSRQMPTIDLVRDALQSLNNPEVRLLHELFWFWPLQGSDDKDTSFSAVSQGHILKAEEIWNTVGIQQSPLDSITSRLKSMGDGSERAKLLDEKNALEHSSAVALHNLAVLNHIRAVSSSLKASSTFTIPCTDPNQAWRLSLSYWAKLWNHNLFWDILIERVRSIKDPRLTADIVHSIWSTLPTALLMISAEFAVSACESGDFHTAAFHQSMMKSAGFDHGYFRLALVRQLDPLKKELEHLCFSTQERAAAAPNGAITVVREFLSSKAKFLQTFNYLLGAGDRFRDDAHDLVAQTARSCLVDYVNTTGDFEGALPLFEECLTLADSASLRSRLEEDCETVSRNAEAERNARRTRVAPPTKPPMAQTPNVGSVSTPATLPQPRYPKSVPVILGGLAVLIIITLMIRFNNGGPADDAPKSAESPAAATSADQTPESQPGSTTTDTSIGETSPDGTSSSEQESLHQVIEQNKATLDQLDHRLSDEKSQLDSWRSEVDSDDQILDEIERQRNAGNEVDVDRYKAVLRDRNTTAAEFERLKGEFKGQVQQYEALRKTTQEQIAQYNGMVGSR